MANTKKMLQKSAQKFRRTEPAFHNTLSHAIDYMAYYIKKYGASEVTIVMKNGTVVDDYANDK